MSRREPGKLIKQIREFLLGRKANPHLRFPADVAPRTTNPPELPLSPASCKLANNYYFMRDQRRPISEPTIIIDASKKLLDSKKGDKCKKIDKSKQEAGPTKEAGSKKQARCTKEDPKKKVDDVNKNKNYCKGNSSQAKMKLPTPGKLYRY